MVKVLVHPLPCRSPRLIEALSTLLKNGILEAFEEVLVNPFRIIQSGDAVSEDHSGTDLVRSSVSSHDGEYLILFDERLFIRVAGAPALLGRDVHVFLRSRGTIEIKAFVVVFDRIPVACGFPEIPDSYETLLVPHFPSNIVHLFVIAI